MSIGEVYDACNTADLANYQSISRHKQWFISERSTMTSLLESLNDWTSSVENKLTETVVYVDFFGVLLIQFHTRNCG